MFYTKEEAEIPVGAWLEKGSRSWRFIEWRMNIPWFWVTYVFSDGASDRTDTLMLYLPRDIEALIEQYGSSIKTIGVQMACPPRMNGTTEWSMERLTEIISGVALKTGQETHVFRCVNGTSYVDDHGFNDVPELESQHTIFSTLL